MNIFCASLELSKAETDSKYSALIPNHSGLCVTIWSTGCVAVGNTFIVNSVESRMQSCGLHQEITCRPWVNIQQYSDLHCCAINENETRGKNVP